MDVGAVNPERLLQAFEGSREPGRGVEAFASLRELDWQVLSAALADRCGTAQAAAVASSLPWLGSADLVARRLAEVAEMAELLAGGDRPGLGPIAVLEPILLRATRGACLSAAEVVSFGKAIGALTEARHFFRRRATDLPLCWQVAEAMQAMDALATLLERSFSPEGHLVDEASAELGRLRQRSRRLNETIRQRIEEKTKDRVYEEHLQDSYYTIREGRYVLPVKVQARGRVEGIVHATSASGQTVFVEPADMVALNNALRMVDFDVEAEEQRILLALSGEVAGVASGARASLRRYVYLDGVVAAARLMLDLEARVPYLGGATVQVFAARHPILQLKVREGGEASAVIANDICLDPGASTLVISGSNAGGKTVTLKTLGLFAVMLRAGLPIPAGPSSEFPLFAQVFADIGDAQSITEDKSTFSAHVLRLVEALPRVGPGTLVLLDEPFAGTDPAHASALVASLLERLHQAGATSVVTTHLDDVKAFALERAWAANASVVFDLERLAPTFRLRLGSPGASSAFAIARRLGLPGDMLRRAEEMLAGEAALEVLLDRLEAERQGLEAARCEVERRVAELAAEAALQAEERGRLRRKEAKAIGEDLSAVREEISEVQGRISALKKGLQRRRVERQERTLERLQREAKAVEEAARGAEQVIEAVEAPTFVPLAPEAWEVGRRVYCRSLRRNGVLVGWREDAATVQVGHFQSQVRRRDVGLAVDDGEAGRRPAAQALRQGQRRAMATAGGEAVALVDANPESAGLPLVPQSGENTLDLRGLRGDEAEERLEMFLDSAMRRDVSVVYVIHGHGTGVLKRMVRAYLRQSEYLRHFRPGEQGEGGDGVSVAWLRSQ